MTAGTAAAEVRLGDPLTARELQVVRLLGAGRSNEAIATDMHLAPNTVRRHLQRIGAKLGTGDRAGIVGAAFRSGQLSVARGGRDVELGPRETRVLIGLARGRSNGEIAAEMFLSEHAVKHAVGALLRALGVSGRAAAVWVGLECGALTLVPRQPQGPVGPVAAPMGAGPSRRAVEPCDSLHGPRNAAPGALRDFANPARAAEALQVGQTRNGTPVGTREASGTLSGALRPFPAPSASRPSGAGAPQSPNGAS